jgi:deoxyribonuclease V
MPELIAIADVDYRDDGAVAACVLARGWADAEPDRTCAVFLGRVEPYEPGRFYLRELPCLLAVLAELGESPGAVVVDGYVWLGDGMPGLGARLFEALGGEVPIVGVAKTRFQGADGVAEAVLRGASKSPLYVTAAGMDVRDAANCIRAMHGPHRVPALLKRADRLCRDWRPPGEGAVAPVSG